MNKKRLIRKIVYLSFFIVFIVLVASFFIYAYAYSDRIDNYDMWVESHFGVSLPYEIKPEMVEAVDPGYILVKISDRQIEELRNMTFKKEGYCGWKKFEKSPGIGYEKFFSIPGRTKNVWFNRMQTEEDHDFIALFINYDDKQLICDWGYTTGSGFPPEPMQIRKTFGLPILDTVRKKQEANKEK